AIDARAGDMDAVTIFLVPFVDEPVRVNFRRRPSRAVEIFDIDRRCVRWRKADGGCRRADAGNSGGTQEIAPRQGVKAHRHLCLLPQSGPAEELWMRVEINGGGLRTGSCLLQVQALWSSPIPESAAPQASSPSN